MNKQKDYGVIVFAVMGWFLLTIITLKFSYYISRYGTISQEMMNNFLDSLTYSPFENIVFTKESMKNLGYTSGLYWVIILGYFNNGKKFLPGKEHGSARWAKKKEIQKVMDSKNKKNNIIFTATEGISLDCRVPGVNLNTLVMGGSGTGKTRFFLKPNIMQMNSSYVITDPKGEVLRATGKMLAENGYKVRTLNLVDMDKSSGYNPFHYLREGKDEDVMTLINTIMTNTQDKKSTGDPFWEKAEMLFLQSLFFYLVYEAPKNEQNIPMVMELIRAADIKEEQEEFESDLDTLFRLLEEEKGAGHIAVVQYKHFKVAAGKTAKSIVISAAARLAPYNISAVAKLALEDEMNMGSIGEEKTALFIIISPTNTTFNFIAAMLYTQLFAELDYVANWKYGGTLPINVCFLLDEFANIGRIPNFEKILAYARSLGLSIVPIFQSLSQLKEMYKDSWGGIIDNCSLLFLGGQGQETVEYISKMLGKATINTKSTGKTSGRQRSSNENIGILGRELMTPDEVRLMPPTDCLLFVKGIPPYLSKKYDITKHPSFKLTEDGNPQNRYEFYRKEQVNFTDMDDLLEKDEQSIRKFKELYQIKDLEFPGLTENELSYEYENE